MSDRRSGFTAAAIVAVCVTLMTLGVVMIASASASPDRSIFGAHFWRTPLGRQIGFLGLGFVTILGARALGERMLRWSPRAWGWIAGTLLLMCVAVLVAVLVPGIGVERNGARRWIEFGPTQYGIRFQPSELAKLALVIVLAALLSRPAEKVRSFVRGLIPGVLVVGVIVGLVGIEDFGTAAFLAAVGGLMLVAGGCRLYQLLLSAVPGLAAFGYLLVSEPYRVKRLVSFLDIWADPQGAGYHPIQSLATIASGGWFGRGLGGGVQKYGYLPESRTDFIFSVICEETGVVGALVVILLFVVLIWLGVRAASHAPSAFGRLLAFGVTLTVGLQAAMNIAVVTVCAPTTGISLPLVSAGGSGVIFLGAGIGLLAAVAACGSYGGDLRGSTGTFVIKRSRSPRQVSGLEAGA